MREGQVMIDREKTGMRIRRLLEEREIGPMQLQEVFGFGSPQAIYKWVAGTSLPSPDNLILLTRVLHVKLEDILCLVPEEEMEPIVIPKKGRERKTPKNRKRRPKSTEAF